MSQKAVTRVCIHTAIWDLGCVYIAAAAANLQI